LIVVDASVLINALGDDGVDGQLARRRLIGERLAAPELIDLELAAALRRLCGANRYSSQRASQALSDLHDLRLDRVPHRDLIGRCWELRKNVTIYDASYIAVAELFDVHFVTADARLAKVPGAKCKIEILT
jgi:predicted nucleic acid-binding protein